MWRCTCVPRNVYDFLYPFKPLFRCAQAQHFVIFCWLVVAIIRDPGVGTLKGASLNLSPFVGGQSDQNTRQIPPPRSARDGRV